MEVRKCGAAGQFEVPVLCVGAWAFGGSEKDYWGASQQSDVDAVVRRAVELGCTFFDTAEAYNGGNSEVALGKAIAAEEGLRAKLVVGSKILPGNCHPGKVTEHLEATLKRLQVDYVDLYMVHWPFKANSFWGDAKMPEDQRAVFAELVELQKQGKLKHIGVSNFGVKQLTEALAAGATPVINELPYGVFLRGIEYELIPLCQANGIGILAYSPLMQGLVTDTVYESADALPPQRCRTRHFRGDRPMSRHGGPGCEQELFHALGQLRALAKREGLRVSDMAIAWTLANPAITSCIVGSRTVAQLEENAAACSLRLSPAVVAEISEITEPVKKHLGSYLDTYSPIEEQRTE